MMWCQLLLIFVISKKKLKNMGSQNTLHFILQKFENLYQNNSVSRLDKLFKIYLYKC